MVAMKKHQEVRLEAGLPDVVEAFGDPMGVKTGKKRRSRQASVIDAGGSP
jgi:hypothetical protein